ncbi:MAG TPA: phosphoribosylglycinamide formyltransferase [Longimicrobiales bacterium]|nr:phosphoribosylglycinamide formyltransferase [Longimicrobiales bacterium]
MSVPIAVLASGGGSNLQALMDNGEAGGAGRVALVISDREDAGALERARRHGIPAVHVAVRSRDAETIAAETLDALHRHDIRFIALAGYLRLVPAPVIRAFDGRMLNIHPALLPAFGGRGMYGLNVHRAVLAAGCRVSGATVHRVTDAYDEGGIVAQWPVPVLAGDTPESLAARVLAVEHVLYPAVVNALLGDSRETRTAATGDPIFRLAATPPSQQLNELAGDMLHLAGYQE